ncbi:MAG: PQQ-binding-like beta-propeller repeat protein, partial [Planctomycetaceae bacterium]
PDAQAAMQRNLEMQTLTQSLIVATSLRNQLVRTNTTAQLSASATTLFVCEDASGTTADDQYRIMFRTASRDVSANNFIRAYDLKTGLFKWEIGGQTQSVAQPKGKGNLLAGFYFLGAPLILGNRTYVLAESSEGIFLLQIAEPAPSSTAPTNPRVVRSQLLTQPQFSSSDHPVRKHAGLVPSYAHGLLICPTCDERIVAVSAEDNAVRWVFRYGGSIRRQELGGDAPVLFGGRDPWDSGRVDLDARWTDSLPRIAGNHVIVTPRDSDELFCLDLQSGQERWKLGRNQFHSIAAIVEDKIILCGNHIVQAFRLADGQPLWSQSIVDGIVCGHPATDGALLQIPTSEPAIVTLDVQTGRRLVTQRLSDAPNDTAQVRGIQSPGNLLIIGDQLLSQNLDSIRSYAQGSDDLQFADQATERLLQNDTPGAISLLEQGLNDAASRATSRSLLIEVLMESLHADFAANQSSVGRIRELIAQEEEDRPVADVLHLMLGMSLPDAALLPEQLNRRSQRQLSELSRLIAQGLSESNSISVQDLVDALRSMLPELVAGQKEAVSAGSLRRLKSLTVVSGIRHALERRTPQDRMTIQSQLREAAVEALTSERSGQLQFVRDLAASGMPQLALHVLQSVAPEDSNRRGDLVRQQIHFEIMRAGIDDGASVTALLDELLAHGDTAMIRAIHAEFSAADAASPFTSLRLVTAESMVHKLVFETWFAAHADVIAPEDSPWGPLAKIDQSDHRTVMSPRKLPGEVPNEAIPLYGSPGKFRGWSFVVLMKEQKVAAYDANGRIRWTLPVAGAGEDLSDHPQLESYLTTSGHLLLLNLAGSLFSLDTSHLIDRMDGNKQVTEPRVLWTRELDSLATDPDADDYRSYVEAADRVTQFAPQMSGYYPVAPVTPTAVALVAGRRLLVYDSVTGRPLWQLDGIARDAVLSTTRDSVLVLSESSRQIEARSLVDGAPLHVSRLPEWWGDAISNVGSSVSDFQIEPGEELLWRIAVQGQSCVLFRLGTTDSALECRDLMTDTVTWSIDLPAESVFSNVANDVVATLGSGSELKLVRIDTGQVLASHDVTPVPEPRDLFLVQSLGNYVVLPEAVDDPSIDLDPVMEAMHVYGRMYCIDGRTMELRWDEQLDHRYIRRASAQDRVILPNSPIMVLLNRGGPADPETKARRVVYGARVIDVRTGRELLKQEDVGQGLNDFWMRIDAPKHQLELSFESHIFTLDFSDPP